MLSTLLKKIHGHLVGQHDFPTLFGEASVYSIPDEEDRPVRVLAVDGVLQSATYLDERWALCPFEYLRGFDHIFEAAGTPRSDTTFEADETHPIEHVLMIGGAGFAYPKQLLTQHPGVKLDVVEIDETMVNIAREFFFLDRLETLLAEEGRADDLRIFVEDGEEFLRRRAEQGDQKEGSGDITENQRENDSAVVSAEATATDLYDAIIIDAFAGREDVSYFRTDDGITAAKRLLTPGGLLMFNCVIEYTGDDMYRLYHFVEDLRKQFAQVSVIDASDEQFGGAENYLVVATDGTYPFTNVIPYD